MLERWGARRPVELSGGRKHHPAVAGGRFFKGEKKVDKMTLVGLEGRAAGVEWNRSGISGCEVEKGQKGSEGKRNKW